ncbi:prepilin peptidase [Massilia phosphatilytica]|nr:prepilin peptidase [Massilia phosphatilytica]
MEMSEQQAFFELVVMLATDPRTMVLFTLLVTAAAIDARRHRIPNWLTVAGLVLGLGYSAIVPFYLTHGFLWSLGGAAIGFGVLFPLWLLRILGAGDVKLMAMTGALLGADVIWTALAGSLVAGGLFAIVFSLWRGRLGAMLGNVGRIVHAGSIAVAAGVPMRQTARGWQSVGRLPFGLPIAAGTICTVVASHFGFL